MKRLLLSFDIEEFDVPLDYGISISKDEQFKISYNGLIKILELLDRLDTRASFFITYNFAKQYKNLVKKMSLKHEIGLHGHEHSDNYKEMDSSEAYLKLKKAKLSIEKIIGKRVIGFRAPKLQRPKYSLLSRLGFKYDSSLNPIFIPGRYNNFFKKRKSFVSDGVRVIPSSVVPIIRFPLFWLSFHIFNLNLIKFLTRFSLIGMNYLLLYFHSWEFMDIKAYKIPRLFLKKTGNEFLINLENYIKWCFGKGLKSETIAEYLKLD